MKLSNGYGSVTKLSGKRRRPWIVRITNGFATENGKLKQERKILGYYKTRSEALTALAEYNKTPYNIDNAVLTFAEIYKTWYADHEKSISKSTARSYRVSFDHCKPIHNVVFKDLRTADLQKVLDCSDTKVGTQKVILSLWSQLYKFAMANDIVVKDYSAFVHTTADDETTDKHVPFSEEEIVKIKEAAKSGTVPDSALRGF